MESLEFNPQDKEFKAMPITPTPVKYSLLVGWVIKLSGGKIDETKANYILLGVAVIFIILTIFVIMNMLGVGAENTVTYKEDVPPEVRAVMPPEIYNALPSRSS